MTDDRGRPFDGLRKRVNEDAEVNEDTEGTEGTEDAEVLQARSDRPVVRIGDVVRHPKQPWSASVHALLSHLQEVGFVEAPAPGPLGPDYDDVGFIRGISGDEACLQVKSDEAVAQVGQLLRRYHDAVAGWRPKVAPVWFDGQVGTGGGDQLVCHGDVGPWNLVWRDGRLVGLIDWEYATVGTRQEDVAYALHYLAPFRDRSYWQDVLGMKTRPRRRHRIGVFADAYGIAVDDHLVEAVLASQQAGVDLMVSLAAQGRLRQQQQLADGELDRERRAVLWGQGHRHKFLAKKRRRDEVAGRRRGPMTAREPLLQPAGREALDEEALERQEQHDQRSH